MVQIAMQSIFRTYWDAYGGWKAIFKSPFLWAAFLVSLLLTPHWATTPWWDDVLSIMPNLLGFTLGGYAMWISIGDEGFRKLISGMEPDGAPSPYMDVNASFVHFMILQLLSVFCALFAKAYQFELPLDNPVRRFLGEWLVALSLGGYFLAYWIFIYALLSAIAATLALLRVSRWFDMYQTEQNSAKPPGEEQ